MLSDESNVAAIDFISQNFSARFMVDETEIFMIDERVLR